MQTSTHLAAILKRNGQTITFTTGAQSVAARCVVGTERIDRDSRQGGYGNQSALTVTTIAEYLCSLQIVPHKTTANHNQTVWRVTQFARSQVDSNVVKIGRAHV